MDSRVPNVKMITITRQKRKNQTDNEMCNDDAKRVTNPKMDCCKKRTMAETQWMNQKQIRE